jgi:hypothetical protein
MAKGGIKGKDVFGGGTEHGTPLFQALKERGVRSPMSEEPI